MEKQYNPGTLIPMIRALTYWPEKECFRYAEDCSPELWVLFIVDDGKFRYEIGQHQGIAEAGDLLLCPPGTVFRREMILPATFLACNYYWHLPHTLGGGKLLSEKALEPNPSGLFRIQDFQRLSSNCLYLRKLIHRTDTFGCTRRNVLLQDIWQLYAWEWELSKLEKRRQHEDVLMRKVELALRDGFQKPFNMKALSIELGLSSSQLTRRFKKTYGMPPTEYLTALRLNHARTLLTESCLTLDEIAKECGYDNGFYLSRVFTKKMKISPSEYRRAHQV